MHKFSLLGFALFFALLAACGGNDKVRGKQKPGGLSAVDYNRLVDLNRMVQDNIDAREAAHKMITPMLNEKSKPMSEKIAYPNCVKNGEIPENDLTGQIHEEMISSTGSTCPIYWYRRRGWTLATKTMVFIENLEIRDTEYRRIYSRMAMRSMSGSYKMFPEENGVARIGGTVLINNFQTTDHGRITGSVAVNYTKNGDRGFGSVVLSLNGDRWGTAASIGWQFRGSVTNTVYRVGNTSVDKAQFDDLFSSFELDKYMDNALNMK